MQGSLHVCGAGCSVGRERASGRSGWEICTKQCSMSPQETWLLLGVWCGGPGAVGPPWPHSPLRSGDTIWRLFRHGSHCHNATGATDMLKIGNNPKSKDTQIGEQI